MKTPMQEMLEWVRATLPMELDWPIMIERKVKSLLGKEKEMIKDAYTSKAMIRARIKAEEYYNETFNTTDQ